MMVGKKYSKRFFTLFFEERMAYPSFFAVKFFEVCPLCSKKEG